MALASPRPGRSALGESRVGVVCGVAAALGLAAPAIAQPGVSPPMSLVGAAGAPTGGARACAPAGAGSSPLRRLTRAEYNNAVADLLGDDADDARHFPEEGGSGFDNNADLAVATRIHAQKYASAAEAIARRAVAGGAEALRPLRACASAARAAVRACAAAFAAEFGARAWRRPLARDEEQRLARLYVETLARGGAADAARVLVQAVLESPHFLYRVERGVPTADARVLALTDWEIAARLSFFLWGSLPDADLVADARSGRLREAGAIGAHARRMLATPRARATVRRFYQQWLDMELVARLSKGFEENGRWIEIRRGTGASLERQLHRFIDHVTWELDGSLKTLLTAPVMFVDARLAEIYGVALGPNAPPPPPEPPRGAPITAPPLADFVRVDLPPARAAGILTLPAFMATQAKVDETAPIKRGIFVRQQLLCQIPPPPPADMMNVQLPPPKEGARRVRDRLEEHLLEVGCSKCHRLFDPLGLAFENYDTLGRYRTEEDGRPIDTKGKIIDTDVDGAFEGAVGLAARLAESRQVADCMVRQWFRFAFGRTESEADACTIAELGRRFEAAGRRVPELLVAITEHDAFRHRAAPEPASVTTATTKGKAAP